MIAETEHVENGQEEMLAREQPMIGESCVYYARGDHQNSPPVAGICTAVLGPGLIEVHLLGTTDFNPVRKNVRRVGDPSFIESPHLKQSGTWDWVEIGDQRRLASGNKFYRKRR